MAENPKAEYKFENFPAELRDQRLWVLWRFEDSDERERCKVPKRVANPEVGADSTKPETWATFQGACSALQNFQPLDKYKDETSAGVGCVITDGYVGLDLDKCYDEAKPEAPTADWAKNIIHSLPPTYAELTPSRRGFHLWYKLADGVQPPTKKGVRTKCAEVYLSGRYFTVTGWSAKARPEIHRLSQAELDQLIALVEATREKKESATKPVLKEDQELALLMNGKLAELGYDPTGDSNADLRLCGILAKRFKGNAQLIEQVWTSSGLRREKLNRADYIKRTIDKALENFQVKPEPEAIDPETWVEHFTPLSTWKLPPPEEIVEGIVVTDAITVLAGLYESYKSMFALELCAAIRQQRKAFDFFQVKSKHDVLYLCLDMPHRGFLRYASFFSLHEDSGFRAIDPNSDANIGLDDPRLHRAVAGKVLVLDTMLDYARIKEATQSGEWIEFFGKLRQLIQSHHCIAIVLIAHPTKSGARSASIDVTEYLKDSVTFGGKVDLAFAFKKEPNSSKVWVQRVKQGRFYETAIKFTVTPLDEQGNSYLSQGKFPICETPEQLKHENVESRMEKKNKGGRPADSEKELKVALLVELRAKHPALGFEKLGKLLHEQHPQYPAPTKNTVKDWLDEYERENQKQDDIPF